MPQINNGMLVRDADRRFLGRSSRLHPEYFFVERGGETLVVRVRYVDRVTPRTIYLNLTREALEKRDENPQWVALREKGKGNSS